LEGRRRTQARSRVVDAVTATAVSQQRD
jgi:hypothetical protein